MKARIFALPSILSLALIASGCLFNSKSVPIPTTQSSDAGAVAAVRDWSTFRDGYLDAITVATAARSVGKLSDKQANEFEAWRQFYVLTVLSPKSMLVARVLDAHDFADMKAQQDAVERSWLNLLPNPYQRPK